MKLLALLLLLLFSSQLFASLPKVKSGRIERLQGFSSVFIPPRNIDIWLPDDYSAAQRYAVVYMHDGQMLFDGNSSWNQQEWRVDEVAAALMAEGKTRPFIVVGIFNAAAHRHSEYFPQKPFQSLSAEQQQALYQLTQGEQQPLFTDAVYSDNYLKFLVQELKPYIDSHFNVLPDATNTFVMGSSMGGLISMYAISEYPGVFGGAACLSTHWPGVFAQDDNPVPAAFFAYMRQALPVAGKHKLYFDFGTATLDAWYPPLQAQADAIIKSKGYTAADWQTLRFDGAEHSEHAWAERLHLPLTFLLGTTTTERSN
ncbi:MAG TPA: alpha/beta hydrolase-fold protein [Rheinheimera sp.]|uniref:alpha/beta hydrolase n=1 Tax=Rheinheimera sp. TaxID=1869214 RepID=UPI002F924A90